MSRIILLDSGPLGMIAHPRATPEIKDWLANLVNTAIDVRIPAITDYEVRRELLLTDKSKSITLLNQYRVFLGYIELTDDTMLLASQFWAQVRKQGRPTSDRKALDGDVILAAQAVLLVQAGHNVTIATTNVKHLSLFVDVQEWHLIRG